jgi:triacylglycerol lipase
MYLIKLEVRHYTLAYLENLEDNIDFCTADRLPQIYYALNRLRVETGAFAQLTRKYMTETFNPNTPDVDDVR